MNEDVEVIDVEVRTRLRFDWKYWQKPSCGTPVFISDFQFAKGDHFQAFKEYCDDAYDDVMQSSLCPDMPVQGGSCVIVYEKRNFKISKETPYIFTKDKRGYKIAFKLDAKGKKRRIKTFEAHKQKERLMKLRKHRAQKQKKLSKHVLKFSELGNGCKSIK